MNVFYFLRFSLYSNQKNNKLFSFCRLQRFCLYFIQKLKGATLFKCTILFIHPAGCIISLLLIKNYMLGMLQSFGGELNYFGAIDYMNLQTCFEPAGYVGEILETPLFD